MMTQIDILDIIKGIVSNSPLSQEVNGEICDTRPLNSTKEDICVKVLANMLGQHQTASIRVNVYVGDIHNRNQDEWNKARLRKLSKLCLDLLSRNHGNGWQCVLQDQVIEEVNGKNEHVIINRLFFQTINE